MRVSIAYSVELENVPDEIRKMLDNVNAKQAGTDEYYLNITDCMRNKNYSDTIENINQLRQELATVDVGLQDCANILLGYQNTLLQLQTPQEDSTPQEEPSSDFNLPDIDWNAVNEVVNEG